MIRQLQNRFIRIAVISLTVAMVLVVGIVNIANWISVRNELSDTLSLLTEPEMAGAWPEGQKPEGQLSAAADQNAGPAENAGDAGNGGAGENTGESGISESSRDGEKGDMAQGNQEPMPRWSSRHFRSMAAESRWFSAILTEDGQIDRMVKAQLGNMDEETARELILQAAADGRSEGMKQDCLFRVRDLRDGRKEIIMLNCETRLATVRTLVLISALACAGGILLAWLLVTLASRKAVGPIIRNMEQQKQFITNASHELKTPLTVIATNMQLIQMEDPGNQWVKSTQKQTAVMRHLVDELVYLSRMEEGDASLQISSFDPGQLLKETAEPFIAMAEFEGTEMRAEAEAGLRMTGDRGSIQRLMSTLCDNAVKYASEGPILAEIRGEGRHILLRVSNPVDEPLTKQQCQQLFNRFYRADASRNKEKQGGFGIGLAIAAAVTEKHGGRISAAMEGERLVFTCELQKETKE